MHTGTTARLLSRALGKRTQLSPVLPPSALNHRGREEQSSAEPLRGHLCWVRKAWSSSDGEHPPHLGIRHRSPLPWDKLLGSYNHSSCLNPPLCFLKFMCLAVERHRTQHSIFPEGPCHLFSTVSNLEVHVNRCLPNYFNDDSHGLVCCFIIRMFSTHVTKYLAPDILQNNPHAFSTSVFCSSPQSPTSTQAAVRTEARKRLNQPEYFVNSSCC